MHRTLLAGSVLTFASLFLAACGDDSSTPSQAATAVKGDAFCIAAEAADKVGDDTGPAFDSGDPAAIETAVAAAMAATDSARKLVPKDIQATVDSVTAMQVKLRDLFAANDYDFTKVAADPAFAEMQADTDASAQSAALDTYLKEKCGIPAD